MRQTKHSPNFTIFLWIDLSESDAQGKQKPAFPVHALQMQQAYLKPRQSWPH